VPAPRGPGHVDDALAVGRPARHELAFVGRRQPAGRPVRQVHRVKLIHGVEDDLPPVGRNYWPADQARAHGRSIFNANRRVHARGNLGLNMRRERNGRGFTALEIDPMQLATDRHEERAAIGHERVARQGVAARA